MSRNEALAGRLETERVSVAAEVTRRIAQVSASDFRLLAPAATFFNGLLATVPALP
jgi:hypothetical protein